MITRFKIFKNENMSFMDEDKKKIRAKEIYDRLKYLYMQLRDKEHSELRMSAFRKEYFKLCKDLKELANKSKT